RAIRRDALSLHDALPISGEFAAVEVETAVAPRVRAARADFLRQVHAVEARELARGLDRLVRVDVPCHQRAVLGAPVAQQAGEPRSEEHTSELQSRENLVC